MRAEFGLQQIDQSGFHELEVVGDAEDDQRFVAQFAGEAFLDAGGVRFLHADDHVGPADVAGGEFDARAVVGAGGAGLVARMVFEERFGSWAAPIVAGADEEKFGFHAAGAENDHAGPSPSPKRAQTAPGGRCARETGIDAPPRSRTFSGVSRGETENHRQLKALALAWARANGFAIAAAEVRVPKSGCRADVAACSRGTGRRTAVFECKQARADLLKDARREDEARRRVAELAERLRTLEALIGAHRPDLRRGESLFAEFDAWDFSGLEHATHRKVVAELAAWQERLQHGTKFAKLRRWRAADYFYLVSEAGIFAEAEIPAGWGLLVRSGDTLALARRPVWTEPAPEQRVALLEAIALAATRRVAPLPAAAFPADPEARG